MIPTDLLLQMLAATDATSPSPLLARSKAPRITTVRDGKKPRKMIKGSTSLKADTPISNKSSGGKCTTKDLNPVEDQTKT